MLTRAQAARAAQQAAFAADLRALLQAEVPQLKVSEAYEGNDGNLWFGFQLGDWGTSRPFLMTPDHLSLREDPKKKAKEVLERLLEFSRD